MKSNIFFLYFLSCFFLLACEPKERHELFLNLDVGQNYRLEHETTQLLEQSLAGVNQEMQHRYTVGYNLFVKDYSDGVYTLEFEYKNLLMDVEGPGISLSAGTCDEHDLSDTLSLIFKAFIDKPFTLFMSKSGKVNFIDSIDDFFDLVVADLDFVVTEDDRNAILGLDEFIGERGLRDNLSQITNYLPEKPVSKKEQWETKNIQTTLGFAGKWNNQWQLVDIDESEALVKGMSEFEILEGKELNNLTEDMPYADQGLDVTMEGIKKMKHIMERTTGLLKEGEEKSKLNGYFNMGKGHDPSEMLVSIEITSISKRIK